MNNQPRRKNFLVPLCLAIVGIAAVGATVVWKDKTTAFLQSLNNTVDASSSQPADVAERKPDILLAPPVVAWVEQPQASAQNRIAMKFKVSASTTLKNVKITITPVVKLAGLDIDKEEMSVPAYFIGHKTLEWDGQLDLTGSLLAGRPAILQIAAIDNDGREGASETVSMTLPEHTFQHPVAKTIYDLRKTLREAPMNKRLETLRGLAMLLQQRDNFDHNDLTLLTLRSAAVRIALDKSDDGLRGALDLLWHAAILFEESHPAGLAKS